jgi:hypothetical protein
MTFREVVELQSLLQGVPLPAGKQELIGYARAEGGAQFAAALERLPDREYASLDEVGEVLQPVQPKRTREEPLPRPESGEPPGGAGYTSTASG